MDALGGPFGFLGQNDCTAQSVVMALDAFLRAAHKMRDVVMVPNRLKDMNAVICTEALSQNKMPFLTLSSSGDNNAGSSGSSRAEIKVDLFSFYNTLQVIRNELMCGVPPRIDADPLSTCYPGRGKVNIAVVREETPDSAYSSLESQYPDCSMSDDEGVDVSTDKRGSSSQGAEVAMATSSEGQQHANDLAAVFREHLRGLFSVLNQLTDAAEYLSERYQDEVDGAK